MRYFPIIALLSATGLLSQPVRAQSFYAHYADDALNYSRLQFGGPARTQGIGGANVALGADFGNLTSNPAGLGLYQKSEIHFAPGLGLGTADASGTGPSQTQNKNSFHVASIGAVLTTRRSPDESDWRGGSFALGFTRLADFNTSFRYTGVVSDNQSLFQRLREPGGSANINSDYYQNVVGGKYGILDQDNNSEYYDLDGLAYGTYLTDIDGTRVGNLDSVYTRLRNGPISQGETVTTSGSVSQFDLGYGGSYKDRLYVGGGLGIVSTNRRQIREFGETDNDPATPFASLLLRDEVQTEGTGINARLGLLYRATERVRIGASIQTPTYIRFSETYSTSLTTSFTPLNQANPPISGRSLSTVPGEFAYTLTTPFRANGGVAVLLGQNGFLTGDVEYVGYDQARLGSDNENVSGDSYAFADENQLIRSAYRSTVNLRIGGEARYDVFRFRLGFAHYGNPYRGGSNDRGQNFYTAGIGLRQNNFFLDIAGVYTTFNQLYSPYTIRSQQQPVIGVDHGRYTTTVTAGLTF